MRSWGALLAVLALTAALLLAPLPVVRGADGVRLLGDTDPHYHVLRAERLAAHEGGAPWRDPALDFPNGADIPWPPLFDAAIAALARLAGAGTRDGFALAGAFLPVALGLASVLLVALAGRAIAGPGAGVAGAAVAAPLPALARYAVVGRIDQHVAEVLLATAIAAAFTKGLASPRARVAPLALALAIALSFWTWMGSTVALLAPSAAVALARVAGQDEIAARGARTLAIGAAIAAALLAASIAAFGPPGALGHATVLGIGGLHVAIVVGLAAFAAGLAWRARARAPLAARMLEVVLSAAIPAGLLLSLWPGLWQGVLRGLVALGAANPWYDDIREFNPALFGGIRPVRQELGALAASLGAVPAAAALAIPAGLRRWRADPAARPGLLFLAVWAATTLALSAARNRFFPYFAVPCVIAAAMGALWFGRACAERLRREHLAPLFAAAVLAASLVPAAGTAAEIAAGAERVPERWVEATRWLRGAPPAPDGRTAVAAPWELGHLVQYYADRPVVTSPFGTEAGPRALPDWAKFLFTSDEGEAEAVLLSRRVSLLLLRNPSHELVGLRGFAPPGVPPPLLVARDAWAGESVQATPRYLSLVVSRLYFGDGAGGAAGSIEGVRLLWEGASTGPAHPLHEERLKVFELVAGAELRVIGAAPGATVIATVPVLTSSGRAFTWSTLRTADASGAATLRIPYATGANGAAVAGPCDVTDGTRTGSASVPAEAVTAGATLLARLAAPPRP